MGGAQRYIKRLRMWLYLWERYGYARAEQMFIRDYIGYKGHLIQKKPNMMNVIWGKLEYLKMVKGKNDIVYIKLLLRYNNLCNIQEKPVEDPRGEYLNTIIDILFDQGIEVAMNLYKSKTSQQ